MNTTIEASTTVRAAPARVRQILLDDPGSVFGDECSIEARGARRYRFEMTIDVGAGASAHQEVEVQLGAPRSTDAGLVLPLSWHATGHQRLLPTFDGELFEETDRAGTRLRLCGTYSAPLGVVGRLADRVAGHGVALRSLEALVGRLARRLDAEVDRRLNAAAPSHTVYRVETSDPDDEHPQQEVR